MNGQKILKVTSILMIVGGIIAAITGVIALLSISTLAALSGSAKGTGLLYASSILVTLASVIQIIAGIKGLGACSDPRKAAGCIKWGIFIAGIGLHRLQYLVIGIVCLSGLTVGTLFLCILRICTVRGIRAFSGQRFQRRIRFLCSCLLRRLFF